MADSNVMMFPVGTRVVISRDLTADWRADGAFAVAPLPPIGLQGTIDDYPAPPGKVTVSFFGPDLGFEPMDDEPCDDDYLRLFIPANALDVVP